MRRLTPLLVTVLVLSPACSAPGIPDDEARRAEIVRAVTAGELAPAANEQQAVRLPSDYEDLSAGGEIVVTRWNDELRVVFFTRRGVVDAWEGYVWSDDCELDEDPLGGLLHEVRDLGECWFYARSN
jgi:hypothetical protein